MNKIHTADRICRKPVSQKHLRVRRIVSKLKVVCMKKYEYGRIGILEENLIKARIDPGIIAEIMAGGSEIRASTKPELKADWLREAMLRMDRLLDKETRHAVREACACCLGGKRLKNSKEIFKNNSTLEERIRAANETPFVFGHSVTMQDDGQVLVRFAPEGLEGYRCPACRRRKNRCQSRTATAAAGM
jgi:hypothetical protein